MEDLSHLNPTPCADLERLAAAAATMGYSSDSLSLPSHHIVSTNITNPNNSNNLPPHSLSSNLIPHYSSDPYDLSRSHQYTTIRIAEYQQKPVFDQNRSNLPMNHQQIISPTHSGTSGSKIGPHYAVVDRSDVNNFAFTRAQHFGQTLPTKNINISAPPNIHYIDSRCITNPTETLAVAVSQALTLQPQNTAPVMSHPIVNVIQEEAIPNEVVVTEDSQTEKKKSKKRKVKTKTTCDDNTPENSLEPNQKTQLDEVPDPVEINGKNYFVCKLCKEGFVRKYLYKRHLIFHTGEKRGALSLKTKAEIIKRIKAGEKQVDLAMEYNVGRSTLSFIMKNADKFLGVLKDGKFHLESKRLRGAQREDVEEALYEWYKQALLIGITVSGPILCRKARDFASKLGYQEFKATHGWLDRFKRRKHIVLGRGKTMKEKGQNEEESEEFAEAILPNILADYASNDVFHASEVGLMYRILPNKATQFKGTRCAGGSHSKKRITVLMCTNMTGSEKFPLLVIGKHPKPKCFNNVKSLPVQYLPNDKSWMNKDNFIAWLTDLNSWFVQQNRKVLLVLPNLPIHPKSPKLSAVRVVVSPATFLGPSKLGITHSLKRNYRRAVLESLLSHIEETSKLKKRGKKPSLKLSLLVCLHKLAAAWHAVTDVTISNSFQRSGLGKYGAWVMNLVAETSLGTENLDLLHRLRSYGLKIHNSFTFDDYVTFDDEVQVCHYMDDDDIIASVTGADIESSDSEEDSKDESECVPTEENKENNEDEEDRGPSFSEVKSNLITIRNHICQHPKVSQEMFSVFSHLEYLLHKSANKDPPEEEEINSSIIKEVPAS